MFGYDGEDSYVVKGDRMFKTHLGPFSVTSDEDEDNDFEHGDHLTIDVRDSGDARNFIGAFSQTTGMAQGGRGGNQFGANQFGGMNGQMGANGQRGNRQQGGRQPRARGNPDSPARRFRH